MNSSLPIYPFKDAIINAVRDNDTVILTAETGSGKSTQVPQFLHEAGYEVICTQPRRIACVTLAERVSKEMNGAPVVGYKTAFESTQTPDTRILFVTDGLRLAQGIRSTDVILVIDELHEWNLNIETLIAWVRKHREDGGHIKVVLMSATLDASSLLAYFNGDATHISVPGRSFHVRKHYVLETSDKFNGDQTYLQQIATCARQGKNVLAFRPGKREISDTIDDLKEMLSGYPVEILPMHGELPLNEQEKCFARYANPKIVVATNIAQTSLTIPDINVVVDDGIEKRVEVMDGIESLLPVPISKADSEQRAGRAGRVADGDYYLVSRSDYLERDDYALPEINRLLLDKVVLKLASVGIDAATTKFFHQPSDDSLIDAVKILFLLGAIDKDGGITPLGRKLVEYPMSVRNAMIIEKGREFGIIEDILKAVAIFENGSLVNFKQDRPEGFSTFSYRDFTQEERSDILAEMDIFEKFRDMPVRDLPPGINKKMFVRIREYHNKLLEHVDVDESDVSERNDDYYKNFLKAVYAGYPDRIFKESGWSSEYSDGNDTYKFSKYSCSLETEFVLAVPRNIVFTNKFGNEVLLSLIDKISSIPDELVKELLDPEKITTNVELYPYTWNGERFRGGVEKRYLGRLFLEEQNIEVKKGDKDFSEAFDKAFAEWQRLDAEEKQQIEERQQREREHEAYIAEMRERERKKQEEYDKTHPKTIDVVAGGKSFTLQRSYYNGEEYFAVFDKVEEIPEIDGYMGPFNTPVIFRFNGVDIPDFKNPVALKNYVLAQKAASLNNGNRKRKQIVMESIDSFMKEYYELLGPFTKYDDKCQPTYKWFGLLYDKQKDTVRTKAFDSEEEYASETEKGFKRLFEKWVYENCPSSAFAFDKRGKKVTNKSTEECRDLFRSYAKDIIADTTYANLDENKAYVQQVHSECIGMMEENPW